MSTHYLEKGIQVVKLAAEEDAKNNISSAISFYRESLVYFRKALDLESNENTKIVIQNKMLEYEQRFNFLEANYTPQSTRVISISTAPPQIDWTSLQQAEKKKWDEYTGKEKESSGEIFTYLSKAIKIVEEASSLDSEGKYSEALEIYQLALEYFLKALEAEHNPEIKSSISEKMEEYITRAEVIKEALRGRSSKKPGLTKGSSSSSSNNNVKAQVSPAASSFIENAISTVEKAVEFDEAKNYEAAIQTYDQALTLFSKALNAESNQQVKTIIKDKMIAYTKRVEQLRQFQVSGKSALTPIPLGLEKPGEKYKPPPLKKKGGLFKKEKKTWK